MLQLPPTQDNPDVAPVYMCVGMVPWTPQPLRAQ
jgi:hypothetical protein